MTIQKFINEQATLYGIQGNFMFVLHYISIRTMYGSFGMSGAGVSNAVDMAQWILFQLNEGVAPDGTEILSDAQFRVSYRRYRDTQ